MQEFRKIIFHAPYQKKQLNDVFNKQNKEEKQEREIWDPGNSGSEPEITVTGSLRMLAMHKSKDDPVCIGAFCH